MVTNVLQSAGTYLKTSGMMLTRKAATFCVKGCPYRGAFQYGLLGDTFEEVEGQLDLVGNVHRNALAYVEQNGATSPLHYYSIEGGNVNATPKLLNRIDELTI
jgi:hypothetical protein